MTKLSVVQATRNEAEHIGDNLKSVTGLADETIVVDEYSEDKTREIAQNLGARVFLEPHHRIFHLTKQKAIDKAMGDWVLQIDTDERVTPKLAEEIKQVIEMNDGEREEYQKHLPNKRLFIRHQALLEIRDGRIGKDEGSYVAFFISRRNLFLGKYLKYGGTYPDGVIRLFKKGKAYLPCESVHEQMAVEGKVGWLQNHLLHVPDADFKRYLKRNSTYINHLVEEMKKDELPVNIINFINYLIIKPLHWFFLTQIRHKGILDGWQGIIFSFFSALRFPRAYLRYLKAK